MPGFATTSTQLLAVLNSVDVAKLPVKYEYLETMPTVFPAGFVIAEGGPPEATKDTVNNWLQMAFIIRTILPLEEKQVATQKALAVLDAVAAKFRLASNRTLAGTVHNLQIDGYRQYASDDYGMPAVILDIRVVASVLVSTL